MNEPSNEGLKDNSQDEQKVEIKPPAPQKPMKYPNNLETLRKAKKLEPHMIINRMKVILERELVMENYDGWEKGEHLPYPGQRDALVQILEVKSELDIWPTLNQILEEQREKRRTAALRKYPPQQVQPFLQPNSTLEPAASTPQPEPFVETPVPSPTLALSSTSEIGEEVAQLPVSVNIPVTSEPTYPPTPARQNEIRPSRRQFIIKLGAGFGLGGLILAGGYAAYEYLQGHGIFPPTPTQLTNPFGTWTSAGHMARPRVFHSATHLNDDSVLVAGGRSDAYTLIDITEIYKDGAWQQTKGRLNQSRNTLSNSLVTLRNGMALIVGGLDATQNLGLHDDFSSAELYNPGTGIWTGTGSLSTPRRGATVTLLQDRQRVLVAGGAKGLPDPNQFVGTAELYDLHTGVWMYVGDLNVARQNATAVLLHNGKVMLAGGEGPESVFGGIIELFDPDKGKWSQGSLMPWGSMDVTLTVLKVPDDRVLLLGGNNTKTPFASAALYDPKNDTWKSVRPMSTPRSGHTTSLLPNGFVLVVGGANKGESSCEVYDPKNDRWFPGPPLLEPRGGHMAVTLNNGDILIIGGSSPASGAELDTCERFQVNMEL